MKQNQVKLSEILRKRKEKRYAFKLMPLTNKQVEQARKQADKVIVSVCN